MEIDVNKIIQEKIKSINVDEIFEKELNKQIAAGVASVLRDAVGPYSKFMKDFEATVEEKLNFDPKGLDFSQYSEFVVEQCVQILKNEMSEDKASHMTKKLREKLGVVTTTEIEWEALLDVITDMVKESFDDEDFSDRRKVTLKVTESDRDTFEISVQDGSFDSDVVRLFVWQDGKCYHHNGDRRSAYAKLFAGYVYQSTYIKNIEVITKEFTREDFI